MFYQKVYLPLKNIFNENWITERHDYCCTTVRDSKHKHQQKSSFNIKQLATNYIAANKPHYPPQARGFLGI